MTVAQDRIKLIKVLIIDDSPIFLSWLGDLLKQSEEFELIGQADNGTEGIQLAVQLEPDLVVSDFFLDDIDGLEVASAIRRQLPKSKIVIVSSHENEASAAVDATTDSLSFIAKQDLNLRYLRGLSSGGIGP